MIDLSKKIARIKVEYETGMKTTFEGEDLDKVVGMWAASMMFAARLAAAQEAALREAETPPQDTTSMVPNTLLDAIRAKKSGDTN